MDILEGALGFAVAMILFSTIVTGLTEFAIKLFGLRPKTVARQITQFVESEISRKFRKELEQKYPELTEDGKWEDFTAGLKNLLTDNPLAGSLNDSSFDAETGTAFSRTSTNSWMPWRRKVDELSTYAFLQRLARSPVGAVICELEHEGAHSSIAVQRAKLQDLVRTFERYTAAGHERLRKNAQVVSIVIAIVLAFSVNIDAWRLFSHLMDNPEAREDLIAEVEAARDASDMAQEKLSKTLVKLQNAQAPPYSDAVGHEKLQKELQAQFDALKKEIEPLMSDTAMPIGPGEFPYVCWTDGVQDARCSDALPEGQKIWFSRSFAWWLLNVTTAGLLIGLGGPFWYNFFASLSNLTQVLRSVGGASRRSEVMVENDPGQPATEAAFQEAKSPASGGAREGDIVSVFHTAAGRTPPVFVNG